MFYRNFFILLLNLLLFNNLLVQANIFIQWNGRFGNNLFQFAVAYSIAKLKKINIVALRNSDLDVFSLPYKKVDFNDFKYKYFFDESFVNGNNVATQPFNQKIYNLIPDSCISGFFQTDKYFINYRNELISLYKFTDHTIYQEAQEKLNYPGKILSICAHIRLGDYAKSINDSFDKIDGKFYQKDGLNIVFPIMDDDYYIRAISLVLKKLSAIPDDCALFLISDEVSSPILNYIKKQIETSFYDLKVLVVEKNDLVNFAMMNLCDVCITSASSFSWWGAWLNTKARLIVSPKYWFNYYVPQKKTSSPLNIEMSLPNQYCIESKGYLNNVTSE